MLAHRLSAKAVACAIASLASAGTSAAQDLTGWNAFSFGSSIADVAKASNGVAMQESDGTMYASSVDFAGLKVAVTFTFDFGRSAADSSGKLTTIKLAGVGNHPCTEFEPQIKAGLTEHYGAFVERSKPYYDARTDVYGGFQGMQTVASGTVYGLYQPFNNNTFIFAKFDPVDSTAKPNSTEMRDSCNLTLTYGVKDPEMLHPPKPPTMGKQGY